MIAKNFTVMGTKTRSDYTGSYTTASASMRLIVEPGAMIQGNKKDPNTWNYKVVDTKYFRGSDYNYQNAYPYAASTTTGCFGSSSDGVVAPTWDRSLVYNMALSKLNEKVRGGLDLGVDFIEIKQTGRMLSSLHKFETYLRHYSEHGLGVTKDLANGWLLYTYGWKPLMSSIFQAADEAIRVVINDRQRFTAGASLPINGDAKFTRIINGATCKTTRSGFGGQACTFSVLLHVPSSFDASRWSSLNPISLGWEVIPYSFVADWFLDVGGFLRALETGWLYANRFRKGYYSEIYWWKGKEACANYLQVTGTGYRLVSATALLKQVEFKRTLLASYPLPRLPTFKVDLSSNRMISMAALIRQLFD